MGDDAQQDDLDLSTDDDVSAGGGAKKGSFLNPFIIRILSLVALIIAMVVISILVFIFGSQLVQSGTGGAGGPQTDTIQPKTVEHLEYVKLEDPFRQQLRDGKMIQLSIQLGYKENNKKVQQELTQIVPEIRDIVIKYLSRQDSVFFRQENALDSLEEDLLKQINRIINSGKVERILFQEYTLM